MNFVHMQIGHVSRSSGRSSVQAVAYVTGTCMNEDRRGMTADHSNRGGVEAYEILAPEGSGIAKDDLEIWNRLENYEDEYALKRYKTPETQNKYMAEARTAQTYFCAVQRSRVATL